MAGAKKRAKQMKMLGGSGSGRNRHCVGGGKRVSSSSSSSPPFVAAPHQVPFVKAPSLTAVATTVAKLLFYKLKTVQIGDGWTTGQAPSKADKI